MKALGIDIGGTKITFGIVDLKSGKIIKKETIPTPERYLLEKLIKKGKELLSFPGIFRKVGVGVPGLVDKGRILQCPNLSQLNRVSLKGVFEEYLRASVCVDNDVVAATLSEKYFGAGKKTKNFICVFVGTGIGGGIVIDGKIYRGAHGMAGEFGHTTLSLGSPLRCNCGRFGCFESLVSGPAIYERAKKRANFSSLEEVITKAEKGDPLALRLLDESAEVIGAGTGSLINIFDPELVIFGGGVMHASQRFFERASKRALNAYLEPRVRPVRFALARKDAGVVGAACLIHNQPKRCKPATSVR